MDVHRDKHRAHDAHKGADGQEENKSAHKASHASRKEGEKASALQRVQERRSAPKGMKGYSGKRRKPTRMEVAHNARISSTQEIRLTDLASHERVVLAAVAKLDNGVDLATQAKIGKLVQRNQSQVSRTIRFLVDTGFVEEKAGTGSKWYSLTPKGEATAPAASSELMRRNVGTERTQPGTPQDPSAKATSSGADYRGWRGNNLRVMVPIHRRPSDDKLLKAGWRHNEGMRGWKPLVGRAVLGVAVNFLPNGLMVHLPHVFAQSARAGAEIAFGIVKDILEELHREFPDVVFGKPDLVNRITTVESKLLAQEWARLGDEFAKMCMDANIQVRTERVVADGSLGEPELEFPHRDFGQQDAETYTAFITDVITKPETWAAVPETVGKVERLVPLSAEIRVEQLRLAKAQADAAEYSRDIAQNVKILTDMRSRDEVLKQNEELKQTLAQMKERLQQLEGRVEKGGKGQDRKDTDDRSIA